MSGGQATKPGAGGTAAGAGSAVGVGSTAGVGRSASAGASARARRRSRRGSAAAPGFPAIGATVPAMALTSITVLAGAAAAWAVIGLSGWLVIALLFVIGAASVPRGPFAAILTVHLSAALALNGDDVYTGRFVILLAVAHLLFVVAPLSAWLPWRARVQIGLLRPVLLRYVVLQVVAQAVAFVVLTFVSPSPGGAGPGAVWLGIVGAAAALALAVAILVPALLRPSR